MKSNIYLLLPLVNFRNSIKLFTFPYVKHVNAIISNSKVYLSRLRPEYQQRFVYEYQGHTRDHLMNFIQDPFDKEDFFLEKMVPFLQENIGGNMGKPLFKLQISISYILSFSCVIPVIHCHCDWLRYDQVVELCLVASLLNNTARFNHAISEMIEKKLNDDKNGHHPNYLFHCYLKQSMKVLKY